MSAVKSIASGLMIILLAGCGEKSPAPQSRSEQSALTANASTGKPIPAPCGEGGLALGDVVAPTGSYDVRTLPGLDAPKIKNEKASRVFGKDHYHQIDKSTTVRRLCAQSEWTEIQIQSPEWLTHVKGWVPNEALREIERTESGKRIYVDNDFRWDKDTSQFKPQILAVVNKISRENSNCGHIETATLAKAPSRSKPGDPVFFVTCGSGKDVFNVWFSPKDADAGTQFAAREPLEKSAAADACEIAAKQAATHPSTVNFSRVWDMSYMPHLSGRARVVSTFTAKNAFNLELKYRIDCLFDGPALIETSIAESTG